MVVSSSKSTSGSISINSGVQSQSAIYFLMPVAVIRWMRIQRKMSYASNFVREVPDMTRSFGASLVQSRCGATKEMPWLKEGV